MDKGTINRQQAIDSVQGIERLATLPNNDAVIRMSAVEYVLYNLPSAQTELENKILAIGYTGKEGHIYIGGRLFAVRELAQ